MKMSRDGLYILGGSILLMTVPVLQVALGNLSFLVWHDFWLSFLVVAVTNGIFIAVLILLFPRRLSIPAAVAIANWLSTYHVEIKTLVSELKVVGAADAPVASLVLLVPPALIVAATLLPRELIARLIGTLGAALFVLAAIPLVRSVDPATVFGTTVDANIYINADPLAKPVEAGRTLPDIIYIVPDRYGSSSVLADVFHHDNSDFLNALRRRDFVVADSARANYLKTQYSLASSMNMQYLEPLLRALDGETRRPQPLYSLIAGNLVTARLKQMGYRYVHVPTWWDGTRQSPQADVTKEFWVISRGGEFALAVLIRSPLVGFLVAGIYPTSQCDALKRQLAYLEDVGGDDRPTFTFAHVLAPHSPILTDAEGNCVGEIDYPSQPPGRTWEEFAGAYSGFVSYINKRFLEIFDRQIANNPNPLIFVLQADEGPYPKAYREYIDSANDLDAGLGISAFDWREATDEQLAMKFGILNAVYLGDPDSSNGGPAIPETLTPVNNWRVIFGRLEGRDYPLLPDRHFIFPTEQAPYDSIDITERLRAIAP